MSFQDIRICLINLISDMKIMLSIIKNIPTILLVYDYVIILSNVSDNFQRERMYLFSKQYNHFVFDLK